MDLRSAARLNALGLRYKAAGQYLRARRCYLRALRRLGGLRAFDRDAVAVLCHNLGGIEHARGRYRRAERWARRGLRVRADVPGPHPGAIASDEAALAAILDGLEQYEEAERLYLAALGSHESSAVPDRREIAHVLGNLGAQYSRRGRWPEAVELLERAVALTRELRGADPELGVMLNNLAFTLRRAGEPDRASAAAEEALDLLVKTLGPSHPWTAACRRNTG